ncbi:MAG: hypothetical protein LBT39_09225 [Treponema sp.]|jgi:hypothetical protein|nr:hypothetical protein [Treponema sp.]
MQQLEGIILDIDRFKTELGNSTGDNIEIKEIVGMYSIIWKPNQQDNSMASISFGFVGEARFSDGVVMIVKQDPETKKNYAAQIKL